MGGAVDAVSNVASQVSNGLTGTGKNAGILGVGQYQNNGVGIDNDAFLNHDANDKLQAQFAQQLAQANARKAQQVTGSSLNTGNDDQFRGQQMQLARQLQAEANGQGPSLAQNQLHEATNRNISQALAMQASQRGANPGQGLRSIGQNVMNANQQAGQQAADLRLQEQQAAQGQLGNVINSGRGADINIAGANASLGQQAALANQQAGLQQQALNDAQSRFFNQGQMAINQANTGSAQDLQKLLVSQNTGLAGANASGYEAAAKQRSAFMNNFGGGAMDSIKSMFAHGGQVPGYASGGKVACMADGGMPPMMSAMTTMPKMPTPLDTSFEGLTGMAPPPVNTNQSPLLPAGQEPGKQLTFFDRLRDGYAKASQLQDKGQAQDPNYNGFARGLGSLVGDGINAMRKANGGEIEIPQTQVVPPPDDDKKGGGLGSIVGLVAKIAPAILAASGGAKVPGTPAVTGDSKVNDKVPAILSPGEIVIPKSLAGDEGKVVNFVRALKSMPKPENSEESELQAKIAKVMAHQMSRRG